MTARQCGACSLCCRLHDVPELDKPQNKWCSHCDPGHGCSIHEVRPGVCRDYSCNWLRGWLPESWFPRDARLIVDFTHVVGEADAYLRITVDPGYPTRWKEEPYYSYIKTAARGGLVSGKWRTVVSLNGKWLLILPDKEVPHRAGKLLKLANGGFDFVADGAEQDH